MRGCAEGWRCKACSPPQPDCRVVAVCDTNGEVARAAAARVGAVTYEEYEQFLQHELDVVVVATPVSTHARYVIAALERGCHVLGEVPLADSIEECRAVAAAVERTGRQYMLAENMCFMPYLDAWKAFLAAGRLGEVFYAEAEYLHGGRTPRSSNEPPTWRTGRPPILYPTHSLGPLLELLGDHCVSATGMGAAGPVARDRGWFDAEVALLRTGKGTLIKLLRGTGIVREPMLHYFVLYGTAGTIETRREGTGFLGFRGFFADVPHLQGMIDFPITDRHPAVPGVGGGHGTWEQVMIPAFVQALQREERVPIDVYRAADFTVPGIIAHASALQGGTPLDVPNLREAG